MAWNDAMDGHVNQRPFNLSRTPHKQASKGFTPQQAIALISLQSVEELTVANQLVWPWLDLKNPSSGSIGCPSFETAQAFIEFAESNVDRSVTAISIALGELLDWSERTCDGVPSDNQTSHPTSRKANIDQYRLLLRRYDYFKVALSGCATVNGWVDRADQLRSGLLNPDRLILVYYADHPLAQSPRFEEVLEASITLKSKFLLFDTYSKGRGRLWDWQEDKTLKSWIEMAHQMDIQVALAGSLRSDEWPRAVATGADVIGFRSAICKDSSRVDGMCCDRLNALHRCTHVTLD